jgi:predicted short-subunit dehydrogenase-like oxidoreductase (DUF2520 family)
LQSVEKTVIIGAGSLAINLAVALHNCGIKILQIVNRTLPNAMELAERVNASFTDNFAEIDTTADLYILAVSDTSISDVLQKINLKGKFIVHTAGTINMNIFKSFSDDFGVFYPLQTFSKTELVTFENIPICIEANSKKNENLLIQLGKNLSQNIQKINSEQRKVIHVSAVFASNFSTYMYFIANEILEKSEISFDILKPLIHRTAKKVQTLKPKSALTGPARRNDIAVMQAHLDLLNNHKEFKEIYKLISDNIVKHFHQT